MAHTAIEDLIGEITVQPGSVVSKVVHRDPELDLTVFAFDTGEGLSEHSATRPAIVQVLSGRLRLTVDGDEVLLAPGGWAHMQPGSAPRAARRRAHRDVAHNAACRRVTTDRRD